MIAPLALGMAQGGPAPDLAGENPLGIVLPLPGDGPPATNALTNPGFEDGLEGWSVRHNVPILVSPGVNGSNRAAAFPDAPWCSYISQPVDPEDAVRDVLAIDFYARIDASPEAPPAIRVLLYDEVGTGVDVTASVDFGVGTVRFQAWGGYAAIPYPPAGWHDYSVVLVRASGVGTLLIDGIVAASVTGNSSGPALPDTFLVGDVPCYDLPNPGVTFDSFYLGPIDVPNAALTGLVPPPPQLPPPPPLPGQPGPGEVPAVPGVDLRQLQETVGGLVPGIPGPAGDAWLTTGNANLVPGVHFLGTRDNVPLDIRVGGVPAALVTSLASTRGPVTEGDPPPGGTHWQFFGTGAFSGNLVAGGDLTVVGSATIGGDLTVGGTITADRFAGDGSRITGVTAYDILDNTITSAKIVDGSIQTADLADGAITSAKLGLDSVRTEHIVDGQVMNQDLANAAVSADKLATNSVRSGHIVDGDVRTSDLASQAVTSAKIATNNVRTNHIADGEVSAADLADGAVGSSELAANSVLTSHIRDGEVGPGDIANGAVTGGKIALSTIRTQHILDGEVRNQDLANGAVSSTKLGSSSVLTGHILDGEVGTGDLADGAVASAKLASGSVQSSHLVDGTIQGADLADGSVTSAKVAAGAIQASHLSEPCIPGEVLKRGATAWGCGADNDALGSLGVCAAGFVPKSTGAAWVCDRDEDTVRDLPCFDGGVVKQVLGLWACAADENTEYDGTDFALSNQACLAAEVAIAISAAGTLACAADRDTLGGLVCSLDQVAKRALAGWDCGPDEDALGDLTPTCVPGQVAKRLTTGWDCAADENTEYGGTDFALSNQACGLGQAVAGVDPFGAVTCAADADTLGGLVCSLDQVAKWGAGGWDCGPDEDALGDLTPTCVPGQVAKRLTTGWDCAADENTEYDGTDFARSNQACSLGLVVMAVDALGQLQCILSSSSDTLAALPCIEGQIPKKLSGQWACAADDDALGDLVCLDGQVSKRTAGAWACGADDDVLGALVCVDGQVAERVSGAWACGVDDNTQYGGTEFALSNQACLPGRTVTGIGPTGSIDCNFRGWAVGGNAGTVPGTDFLGTIDALPFEVRVGSARALRLEPSTAPALEGPNLVGGFADNRVTPGTDGATIAGGGSAAASPSGGPNEARADYATVGGGAGNVAGAPHSAIPGGREARTTVPGQTAQASGAFEKAGDAQRSTYVARVTTFGTAPGYLAPDGLVGGLAMPKGMTWTFSALVTASNGNQGKGFEVKGVAMNAGGTAMLLGTPMVSVLGGSGGTSGWAVDVDTAGNLLRLKVQGNDISGVRWVGSIETAEVGFPEYAPP